MRKYIFLGVVFIVGLKSFSQDPWFNIKYSEPLAVFVYVQHLSSTHSDNTFRESFSGSIYNRDKYKRLLSQFDTLILDYSYEYEGFPYGSKLPGTTLSLIKKQLMNSENLKIFKTQAVGILPNSTLLSLTSILYEFQFIYRELVYQPNKVKFEKQLLEISKLTKTKNLNACFDKGLTFYRAHWDDSFSFDIAFYPLPNSEAFSADAFCNNALCALPIQNKDNSVLLGVMMHEIFHLLYNEQPPFIKNNLVKWFTNNPSKCNTYAYLLFNEVLATAVGNGYVYEALSGKQDEGDWYNRKYINLMAKKIYPMVVDYIQQKKGIDEGFVNIYIKFYEENFSDWLEEMDNLLFYRYILSDNTNDFTVFTKHFPYASLSQYEDEVSDLSIERLKNTPITKVIVVSKENSKKLLLIKSSFPELADWKYKAKQDFFYSTLLTDHTQLIIINTVKQTTEQLISGRITLPPKVVVKK
jgi:hypothetical protein